MRGLTDIYATLFRTDLAVQFQYRAEMIIWLIFRIVEALVFLSVWTAVADSQGGQGGGFSARDFAAYYIAMMMMGHLEICTLKKRLMWVCVCVAKFHEVVFAKCTW